MKQALFVLIALSLLIGGICVYQHSVQVQWVVLSAPLTIDGTDCYVSLRVGVPRHTLWFNRAKTTLEAYATSSAVSVYLKRKEIVMLITKIQCDSCGDETHTACSSPWVSLSVTGDVGIKDSGDLLKQGEDLHFCCPACISAFLTARITAVLA